MRVKPLFLKPSGPLFRVYLLAYYIWDLAVDINFDIKCVRKGLVDS